MNAMKEVSLTDVWAQSHPLTELPQLWAVIYYEGIHGNHILFTQAEVSSFEQQASLTPMPLDPEWLQEVGYLMASYPTYRDLVDYLASLSMAQRQQIFSLYKAWLYKMGQHIKLLAN